VISLNQILLLISLLICSCSRNHTLGTSEHRFGKKAKHIVWLQVDGLEEEHIALVKFASDSALEQTPFEQMVCTGGLWDYNLFDLRPKPLETFMGQILGSQKIKGDCSDLDRAAVWNYFERAGYQVGVLEGEGMGEQSLLNYRSCATEQNFLKNAYFWSQSNSKTDQRSFHYQEKLDLSNPGLFFDKSCQSKECFVSLKTNVTKVWTDFTKSFSKTFFVIRQSEFRRKLVKKDILGARESLQELMETISFFIPKAVAGELSLVITSGSTRRFEFPSGGKDWAKFEKSGRKVLFRRAGLMARAWSIGPGAENFCGTYESSDILRRFIWTPEKDILYFSF
jgi:hypothetical protein